MQRGFTRTADAFRDGSRFFKKKGGGLFLAQRFWGTIGAYRSLASHNYGTLNLFLNAVESKGE